MRRKEGVTSHCLRAFWHCYWLVNILWCRWFKNMTDVDYLTYLIVLHCVQCYNKIQVCILRFLFTLQWIFLDHVSVLCVSNLNTQSDRTGLAKIIKTGKYNSLSLNINLVKLYCIFSFKREVLILNGSRDRVWTSDSVREGVFVCGHILIMELYNAVLKHYRCVNKICLKMDVVWTRVQLGGGSEEGSLAPDVIPSQVGLKLFIFILKIWSN